MVSKKQNNVFRSFLRSFDVDENNEEGRVTRRDFDNYYRNVSAAIDHDKSFENMVRNIWHLNAEGICNDVYINPEYKPRVDNNNKTGIKKLQSDHNYNNKNTVSKPVGAKSMTSSLSPRQAKQRSQGQQHEIQKNKYVYQQPQSIPIDSTGWEEPHDISHKTVSNSRYSNTNDTFRAGEQSLQFANIPGYPGCNRDYNGSRYVHSRPRTPSTPFNGHAGIDVGNVEANGAPVMMDFGNMFDHKHSTASPTASRQYNSHRNSTTGFNDGGTMNLGISSSRPQLSDNFDVAPQQSQSANAANYFNNLSRQHDPSSYLGESNPARGLINTNNGMMGEQYYQPVSTVHVSSTNNKSSRNNLNYNNNHNTNSHSNNYDNNYDNNHDNYYDNGVDGNHVNFPAVNNYDTYNRELGPAKQGRRCRSPKEAFERGQYWKGQARPGSACLGKWKSHLLRDDDPNRIHPQQFASNAMKVMAGGGEHSNLSPREKARKNKDTSKGLRENIIPLPDPYWG